jgi:hypothetical protein
MLQRKAQSPLPGSAKARNLSSRGRTVPSLSILFCMSNRTMSIAPCHSAVLCVRGRPWRLTLGGASKRLVGNLRPWRGHWIQPPQHANDRPSIAVLNGAAWQHAKPAYIDFSLDSHGAGWKVPTACGGGCDSENSEFERLPTGPVFFILLNTRRQWHCVRGSGLAFVGAAATRPFDFGEVSVVGLQHAAGQIDCPVQLVLHRFAGGCLSLLLEAWGWHVVWGLGFMAQALGFKVWY